MPRCTDEDRSNNPNMQKDVPDSGEQEEKRKHDVDPYPPGSVNPEKGIDKLRPKRCARSRIENEATYCHANEGNTGSRNRNRFRSRSGEFRPFPC